MLTDFCCQQLYSYIQVLAEEVDYLKKLNNSFHNKYVLKNDKDINQSCHEGRIKFFIKDKKMTKVQKPKVSY